MSDTCSIKEWTEFGLKNHTEEEIRDKVITDFNNVCFTFVCEYSKMSEEFIEELMVLSTGAFSNNKFDKKLYDKVKKALMYNLGIIKTTRLNLNETVEDYAEEGKTRTIKLGDLEDRLDWDTLVFNQTLSFNFINKYINTIDIKKVIQSKNNTSEFMEVYGNKYIEKLSRNASKTIKTKEKIREQEKTKETTSNEKDNNLDNNNKNKTTSKIPNKTRTTKKRTIKNKVMS